MKKWICAALILMTSLCAMSARSQSDPWAWKLTIRTPGGSVVEEKTFVSRKTAEDYLWGLSPIHSTLRQVTSTFGHPDDPSKFRYDAIRYKTEPGRRVFSARDITGANRRFVSYDAQEALLKAKEWFTKSETDRGVCPPIYENEVWGETSTEVDPWGSRGRSLSVRIKKLNSHHVGCTVDEVMENVLVDSSEICIFDPVRDEDGYFCNSPAPFDTLPQTPYRAGEIAYVPDRDANQLFIYFEYYAELEGRPNFCSLIRGNPCEISTGIKRETTADSFGYDNLEVVRHYTTTGGVRGSFGTDWSGSFDYRLEGRGPYSFTSPDGVYIQFDYGRNGVWMSYNNPEVTASPFIAPDSTEHVIVNLSGKRIEFKNGRPIKIESDVTQPIILEYDDLSRLVSASSSGRVVGFSYEGHSYLVKTVVLPDDRILDYFYLNEKLQHVNFEGLVLNSYEYDSTSGLLSKIVLTDNRYKTYQYDEKGRLINSSFGNSNYGYSYEQARTTITHPAGRTEIVEFEPKNSRRPIKVSSVGTADVTTSYLLDIYGNKKITRVGSHQTAETWFGFEKKTEETINGVFYRQIEETFGSNFFLPLKKKVSSAAGLLAQSEWTYNTHNQVLNHVQTDPVAGLIRSATTTYCEQADINAGTCPLLGLVKSINGARTDVSDLTTFTYRMTDEASCATSPTTCPYRKGDLWKVTNALGHITETLKYDGAGRVLSVKDANAVITDMDYHPRGWLTARKVRGPDPSVETDDAITRIDYWPTGLVKKVTQPDGAFTSYTYDAAHRLTNITDASGNTIHYTLNNAGNKTQEDTKDAQGALKRTLSQVYNQLGQLQTQKDAAQQATGFTYDANGNTDTVTDALTRVTDNDYDPLNRLQRTLQDVGGINAETRFQYDAQDNLTQVTDPKGLNTQYTYNGLGDLTRLTSPDTGITNYTYDSAGNRKTQVDARNKTSTYSYDALNRLTGITYPTTSLNVVYTYDAPQSVCTSGETFSTGRLTKLTDGSGTTQYCHDRFGHLVRKVQVSNGKTLTLRYGTTLGGQLSRITYPNNLLVDYLRDGQGRVTEVGVTPSGGARQVLVTGATYAPFGPVTGWTYGNGRTMQRTLNQNYQPNAITGGPGGLSLGYGFDPVGNLTTLRTALQADPPIATYAYDTLNRLSDVKDGPAGTVLERYGYDATGNRLSVTAAGATTAYTYSTTNHRLSKVGTVTRSYDAGNTTQIGGTARQFVYNDLGRMSQVKAGSTVKMNYLYNGKGEQVRKYVGTTNTYTVYDEVGRWLSDYNTAGAPVQQAIWLDDLPVGVMVGATTSQKLHYIEPDHLGTPRVVIDPVRDVAVWKWELKGEAFGATVPDQNPDADGNQFVFNMRMPGQRYDAASGLNYNYFRDYEPGSGRYVQSDPIGLYAGVSTYSYAFSSPLSWIDPYGLEANPGCVAAVTATCAVVGGGLGFLGGGALGGMAGSAVPIAGTAAGAIGGAELGGMGGAAAGGLAGNALGNAVCPDDDPCKGIRNQLEKHKRKLAEYIANPKAHDNQGLLGQGNDAQVTAWRIASLRKQIAMWERELAKCEANRGK